MSQHSFVSAAADWTARAHDADAWGSMRMESGETLERRSARTSRSSPRAGSGCRPFSRRQSAGRLSPAPDCRRIVSEKLAETRRQAGDHPLPSGSTSSCAEAPARHYQRQWRARRPALALYALRPPCGRARARTACKLRKVSVKHDRQAVRTWSIALAAREVIHQLVRKRPDRRAVRRARKPEKAKLASLAVNRE